MRLLIIFLLFAGFINGNEFDSPKINFQKFNQYNNFALNQKDSNTDIPNYVLETANFPIGNYQLILKNAGFDVTDRVDLEANGNGKLLIRDKKFPLDSVIMRMNNFLPGEPKIAEIYKGSCHEGDLPIAKCQIAPIPIRQRSKNGMEVELVFYGYERQEYKIILKNFPSSLPKGYMLMLGEKVVTKIFEKNSPSEFLITANETEMKCGKSRLLIFHEYLDNPLELDFEWGNDARHVKLNPLQ